MNGEYCKFPATTRAGISLCIEPDRENTHPQIGSSPNRFIQNSCES